MVATGKANGICPATILALGLLGQLANGIASAYEVAISGENQQGAATAVATKPLWLPQSRSDWDAIVSKIDVAATNATDGFEEVLVTAPADLVPMKLDVYDDMWGGILAPVWAIMHPTQAWRILLPIPPE